MKNTFVVLLVARRRISSLVIAACLLSPALALSQTTLQVQQGSLEFLQWLQSINVDGPEALTFRWSTAAPSATSARWEVDRAGSAPITGVITAIPQPGQTTAFTLPPDAFLLDPTPTPDVQFKITITALGAVGEALQAASVPVTVTEGFPPPLGPFDPGAAPSSSGPIEPDHPHATLLAYKPLMYDGGAGKAQGLLDLEFSNPGSKPTSAVTIRLGDLNRVVRQTDFSAYVPSLAPGQTFRVSLALVHQAIMEETPQSALDLYRKGVSILVGTEKIGDSYVQDQQPPVLTGPTDKCAGQGCGDDSPPYIALLRPNVPQIDMSVAAGYHHIYAGDYNDFDVFTKRARQSLSLEKTALARDTAASQLAIEHGAAANLFASFWTPGSPSDVNPGRLATTAASPCDPANPTVLNTDGTLKYQAGWRHGVVKGKSVIFGYPAGGCIDDFYDTRTLFDVARDRFWIVTHGRNQLYAGAPCPDSSAKCGKMNQEATRLTFAAVSKTEDPADGFFTYLVNTEYFDWPVMAVHDGYALFSHNKGKSMRLRLYDADKLATGVREEIVPSYTADDFPGPNLRVAKHHGGSNGLTYIVSTTGTHVSVYALRSPRPKTGRPPLLKSNAYSDPDGDSIGVKEATYRDGRIYLVESDGKRILVWALPVAPTSDGTAVHIDTDHVTKWVIKDASNANINLDYPSIDVNKHDDIVVSYRSWSTTAPNEVHFAVRYHGEAHFRYSRRLAKPTKAGTGGGRIDFVSSSVDPSDDETVYFTGRDQDGAIVGSVRP